MLLRESVCVCGWQHAPALATPQGVCGAGWLCTCPRELSWRAENTVNVGVVGSWKFRVCCSLREPVCCFSAACKSASPVLPAMGT